MKTKTMIMLAASLLVLLASCQANGTTNTPVNQNNSLSVSAPSELNSFKIGDIVMIIIRHNSGDEIVLLPENEVELLTKNENEWISVENLFANSIPRKITLSSTRSDMTIAVLPKIPHNNPVVVRIIVTGVDVATNAKIESYVDVTLSP